MDSNLLHKVSGMLLDLETATMDYARCQKQNDDRYNAVVEEKEDALLEFLDRLVNANTNKIRKTKRKASRCKDRCNNLSREVHWLEGVIEMLEDQLRDANEKLDVARSGITLFSPILNAWEEDDDEWCDDVVWRWRTGEYQA